ncbi:MAG: phosphoribosylglycinamide synthetase C domain-containing protein [Candidatus Bathyarchaeia archaeon]
MEKVGILVVSYGAREAAMVDAFARSQKYKVELYIADKQRNPFNVEKAAKHVVIPDLNVEEICKFAEANKDKMDFGIVGSEKPIIDGVRDLVEERTGIPMICPKKEYAIEASKVQQRMLFQEIIPEVNPRFKIFDPKDYKTEDAVKKAVYSWLDELRNEAVVKPDKPAAGKGVGVWGDHFTSREQLLEHFLSNFQYGAVIIEEKIDGEESSFQAFCDGKHLIPLPETRDYKRAFDDDKGPNTGGMGSYKDVDEFLPFMTKADREKELQIVNTLFEKWKEKANDPSGFRGVPFYVAFMHTGKEPKILENNSRPGDPEIINILPILKDDFVDICYKILEGNLTRIELEKAATVLTYKVPPNYGGYAEAFPNLVNKSEIGTPVNLTKAYALTKKYGDKIRVYPASMELRDGKVYALKSRAVGVLGVGSSIEEARQISLEGVKAIEGGALWHRTDIASKQHIAKSMGHMESLRRKK